MRTLWSLGAVSLAAGIALCACPADPGLPPDQAPKPEPDTSGVLFEPDRVVEVEIVLDPAEWDALRFQTRTIVDIFGGDCLAQPFADPFTYFAATVTIDGETLTDVGVRKKGFLGSLDSQKPSLKIKLDEFSAGNRHHGLSRLTFNNNAQDPAAIRQCLGYRVFADAGVPAPRCNFAHVVVNGEDLGVFTHLESMDKHLIGRFFAEPDGDLWEGTLSDFRPGWTGTFEKKTNEDVIDKTRLEAVSVAAAVPDEELLAALEPLIDVDGFLTLWAVESLIGHWDGYAGNTNNFYLYDDPRSGTLQFLPWGIDQTFRFAEGSEWPPAAHAVGVLARRLLGIAATRDAYEERMRTVMDDAWDESALLAEIDRMEQLLAPFVQPETSTAIDEVRAFVEGRRADVTMAFNEGLSAPTEPLRDAFCFELVGQLDVSFVTTWGTIMNDDVFNTGSGALSGTVYGSPISPSQVGSRAGALPDQAGRAGVQVFGLLDDNSVVAAIFEMNETQVDVGAVELDGGAAIGYLIRFVPATGENQLLGVLLDSNLVFDSAATDGGAPIAGSVASAIYWFPF